MQKFLFISLLVSMFVIRDFQSLCQVGDPDFSLAGFATETTGTTGGSGGTTITVNTGTELQNQINNHKNSETPLTIFVEGTINIENSEELEKIDVKDVSNLSIIGTVNGANFDGIGIKVRRASNLIIRNIMVHHVLNGEKDCISIEGPADHIWVDHCEIYNEYGDVDGDGDEDDKDKDYYDGLLDTKSNVEYIIYSWNYLHDSWKTSLVGSSESDIYDRKITLHHNYYENCYSRLPLFRGGTGHIFNCYYNNIVSTCINSRQNACIRVENNYFENAHNPWVSAYSDVLGGVELIDNIRVNSLSDFSSSDTHEPNDCYANIPYVYESVLTNSEDVKAILTQYAGVGKLSDPAYFETINQTLVNNGASSSSILQLNPNPANNLINLELLANNSEHVKIMIIDITGECKLMIPEWQLNKGTNSFQINIAKLQCGLYLLNVYNQNINIQTKFLKH